MQKEAAEEAGKCLYLGQASAQLKFRILSKEEGDMDSAFMVPNDSSLHVHNSSRESKARLCLLIQGASLVASRTRDPFFHNSEPPSFTSL